MASEEHSTRYRCVAASVEGFIQQVAVSYIRTGHFFYVSGTLGPDADAAAVDAKLIHKYGVDVSRWTRSLRNSRGEANLQYIRYDRFFLLMATHGKSLFFELEGEQVDDCRRMPIKFAGYSLSYRGGHPHVRIELDTYLGFKAQMLEESLRRDRDTLERMLSLPLFVPYAPVRRQLWNVCREMNRVRNAAGMSELRQECLNFRRRIVKPFGELRGVRAIPNVKGKEDMLLEEETMSDEPSDALEWIGFCGPNKEALKRTVSPLSAARPHEKTMPQAVPVPPVVGKGESAAVFPAGWGDGVSDQERSQQSPTDVSEEFWPDGKSKGPVKERGREPQR